MPPSGQGVVIDKKLFSRAVKDCKSKASDKAVLESIDKDFDKEAAALKKLLVEKLMKIVVESSQVFNYYKEECQEGVKFTQKVLSSLDYLIINADGWIRDAEQRIGGPSDSQLHPQVQRPVGRVQKKEVPSDRGR